MKLSLFKEIAFLPAVKSLFNELNVPVNYVADEPTTAKEILKDTYKDTSAFQLIDDVYFVGMVDNAAFEGNKSLEIEKIKSDYDGILIFGITLHQRENNLLPTRSQLAEISRAFNREFYYTPVVLVFKYGNDKVPYLAFANTERLPYKQAWREGEKVGRVSLLRDIDIQKPHRGHEDIVNQLRIPVSGTKVVDSFAKLYAYWQEVFSVSVLNKKFYQELSNWYFWAINHVTFPSKPTPELAHQKGAVLEDLIKEHNATNVIRLLTRLLFTWFIKEKKLIPEELFDLDALQKNILNEISPYHEVGMFAEANKDSVYYKAILQNLFFASLNCPIEADSVDKRTRGFRGDGYGTHRGIDYLMRYKKYFKDPDAFLGMMNETVPFLNGGLFECLDDKYQNLYIDGFSDQMTKEEQLIVPDYLFFGIEEQVDLSNEYGVNNSGTKKAAVKGLINILKSYKFTITENTPVEEDVALDPELLGKVFENLLASYNPETKSTARKQTGSFYTPREIVSYMVDESLIAYLKNAISWKLEEKELDEKLHHLISYDPGNPFEEDEQLVKDIVSAIDQCKILDPACGSGAFPMGVLQKMVHILQKLDPENKLWKAVQRQKVQKETEEVFEMEDKKEREEKLIEINNAFDQNINDPDYARKLYLIENCIYGVDIQPIATQIAKLRFFISLVVDQKKNEDKPNFGIRALPNLETRFVTANTLIGIEKPKDQLSFYDSPERKALETELKKVRHKLFSVRTKDTKLKYRQKDKELRNAIAEELKRSGWQNDNAEKLASWDPYEQNASSSFFDPEWMFDVSDGFNVVIGNPPYILIQNIPNLSEFERKRYLNYKSAQYKIDLYHLFIEQGIGLLSERGVISYITPNTFIKNKHNNLLREIIYRNCSIESSVLFYNQVFESVSVDNLIFVFTKSKVKSFSKVFEIRKSIEDISTPIRTFDQKKISGPAYVFNFDLDLKKELILSKIENESHELKKFARAYFGIQTFDRPLYVSNFLKDKNWKPVIDGGNVFRYGLKEHTEYVEFLSGAIKSGGNPDVYQKKRIVVRQIGKYPEGTFCPPGLYTLNTIYNIFLTNDDIDLMFLLAQINSPVIRYHWLTTNYDNKETFPKIKKAPLESIPVKMSKNYEKIVSTLVQSAMISEGEVKLVITNVIDALIFNLYFPDHMKERDIDVLAFVEQDTAAVMQGRKFEKLTDEEKEKVVEQLHQKWSRPDNEVRNRIKLFAVRSPEILKPILES